MQTGSHINDIPILRVHHHPFPITTPVLVAAHRKGHIDTGKGSAAIIRTKYGPIGATGIRTAGNIHVLRILRVDGNALHPLQITFIQTYPVQQGRPLVGSSVPPVGSSHIGAAITDTRSFWVKNDTVHKASSHYRYALPFVRNGIHRRYILSKHRHATQHQTYSC